MQAALEAEWPHVEELFAPVDGALVGPAVAAERRTRSDRGGRRRGDADRPAGRARDRRRPAWAAHRAAGSPARRDAAPAPVAPGGDVVSDARLEDRCRPARPGAAGGDHRRPRDPARRHRGRPGPRARADHADVLRLPGDGDDPRRPGRGADRRRLPARRRRVRARAGVDHGLDDRRGEGQARGVRRRAARARSRSALSVRCPQCGSLDTRESSRFGSTACKSLWVCRSCREPFDHFKAH